MARPPSKKKPGLEFIEENKRAMAMTDAEVDELLSEEERAELAAEAEADAKAEKKAAAKILYRARLMRQKQEELGLLEPQVEITIDCADFASDIRIDNVVYLQGNTYTLPASKAAVVMEIMQRTWKHDKEINGKSENAYRRKRDMHLNAKDLGTPASQLLRA